MTWREDLARECQRFLEPGEKVRYVLVGKTSYSISNMFWIGQVSWAWLQEGRPRVVCVTDRTVTIFSADGEGNPKRVRLRRGRDQVSCLMPDMAGEVVVGRKRIHVYGMFHDDLGAADTELRRAAKGRSIPPRPLRVRYETE